MTIDRDRRVLGNHESGRPGPLVMVVAGVHGNEHAGVEAARRVLDHLAGKRVSIRGRFTAIVGNPDALAAGKRFVDCDLNRLWDETQLGRLLEQDPAEDSSEQRCQRELLTVFEAEVAGEQNGVVLLDLHSSSAVGSPFSIMADTLQNRRITRGIPIPVILGLEENLDGTLMGYFGRHAYVAVAVEGGQHDEPSTVDHHESAVWLGLVAAGMLDASDVPDHAAHLARLRRAAGGLPRVLETRYRHALEDEHDFEMAPGFTTFQPVSKGDVLGRDDGVAVHCPEDGLLLLPLYQGQGNDGFFIGRSVSNAWLRISALARNLRLDRFLMLMPGIRRDPEVPEGLQADLRIARFLTPEIFNLLGYRGCRVTGERMLFTRRREGAHS